MITETQYDTYLQDTLVNEFKKLGIGQVEIEFGQKDKFSYISTEACEQQYPELKGATITYQQRHYEPVQFGPTCKTVTRSIWHVAEDFGYDVVMRTFPNWEYREDDAEQLNMTGKIILDINQQSVTIV